MKFLKFFKKDKQVEETNEEKNKMVNADNSKPDALGDDKTRIVVNNCFIDFFLDIIKYVVFV